MRQFVAATFVAIGLGGCAGPLDTSEASSDGKYADKACASTAAQRAEYAGANGYDGQLQKSIFAATYADCVRWSKKFRQVLK
jgi:hypothetical protein